MKNIYIFSGLGADKRVFKYLDFSGFNTTFIDWIMPGSSETIEHYAKRLTEQIQTEKPILIGLSFGGIMATEVAKHITIEKIILIASAKTQQEIPFYYRWFGALRIHKWLPASLMKQSSFFSFWLFGIKTKENKKLLSEILKDTDGRFLIWAINAIVNWKNTTEHKNLQHIHGTADRILPIRLIKYDIEVKDGGHFMTINKPGELNRILKAML